MVRAPSGRNGGNAFFVHAIGDGERHKEPSTLVIVTKAILCGASFGLCMYGFAFLITLAP